MMPENYVEKQAKYKIKVGDDVFVSRKAESGEHGWEETWVHNMDQYIGKSFKVKEISSSGILLGVYHFPYFVLGGTRNHEGGESKKSRRMLRPVQCIIKVKPVRKIKK